MVLCGAPALKKHDENVAMPARAPFPPLRWNAQPRGWVDKRGRAINFAVCEIPHTDSDRSRNIFRQLGLWLTIESGAHVDLLIPRGSQNPEDQPSIADPQIDMGRLSTKSSGLRQTS